MLIIFIHFSFLTPSFYFSLAADSRGVKVALKNKNRPRKIFTREPARLAFIRLSRLSRYASGLTPISERHGTEQWASIVNCIGPLSIVRDRICFRFILPSSLGPIGHTHTHTHTHTQQQGDKLGIQTETSLYVILISRQSSRRS